MVSQICEGADYGLEGSRGWLQGGWTSSMARSFAALGVADAGEARGPMVELKMSVSRAVRGWGIA